MDRDYYSILKVSNTSSSTEIRIAYKKLSLICHPDKNPNDPNATKRFQELLEAYDVLSDPEKRRQYDVAHFDIFLFGGCSGSFRSYITPGCFNIFFSDFFAGAY